MTSQSPQRGEITLASVYHEVHSLKHDVQKLTEKVVSEDTPSSGILWRTTALESRMAAAEESLRLIRSVPSRIFWIAAASIISLTVVGTATLLWNAAKGPQNYDHRSPKVP